MRVIDALAIGFMVAVIFGSAEGALALLVAFVGCLWLMS